MKAWLVVLVLVCAPQTARAGGVGCWFEGGMVVAPAVVAGIAGDYLVDTAAPKTLLHETRAQGAGFAEPTATGEVRLAGQRVGGVTATVADLDARAGALPTPVAGVIGVDVLAGFIVDLRLSPCRLTLTRGRGARRGGTTPPMVAAELSDGELTIRGRLAVSTGGGATLALSDAVAGFSRVDAPAGRLARLSILDRSSNEVRAEIVPAAEIDPRAIGVAGVELLGARSLRFDFPRRRLKVER